MSQQEQVILRNQSEEEYLTVKDFCEKYSSIITVGSLRWILHNAKFNGADCFVRRLGKRKLVISPQRFFSWLESNKRGEGHEHR